MRTRAWATVPAVLLAVTATGCSTGNESPDATVTVTATATVTVTATPGAEPPGAGDGPTRSAGAPKSYAQAEERVGTMLASGAEEQELDRFSTLGDRVHCVLEHEFVVPACELARGAVKDAQACASAPGDRVVRIELGDQGGAVPQCTPDTVREPGADVVAPEALVTGDGIVCAVERIGVTCVREETRTGFFLAPGEYALFG